VIFFFETGSYVQFLCTEMDRCTRAFTVTLTVIAEYKKPVKINKFFN
jgi:hypothetical protein